MRSPFPYSLPNGYVGEEGDDYLLAVVPEALDAIRSSGLLTSEFPSGPALPTSASGRGAMVRIPLESGYGLVRSLVHGGLFRFLTGDRFSDPTRPIRELALTAELRAEGVNAPEPIAAVAVRAGAFFRLHYVSRELSGSDLFEALGGALPTLGGGIPTRNRKELLRAAGALIRDLHDRGILHADLHPKNLFVEAGTGKLFVLDLDGTRRREDLSEAERVRNLTRLYRFGRRKSALGEGHAWDAEDFRSLLEGYVQGDSGLLWARVLETYRRTALLHRIGWTLEGAVRGRS